MGANSSKVLIVGNPHSSSSSSAFLAKFSRIIVAVTTRQIDIVSGDEPPSHDQINWIQTKENTKLEYAVSGIRPLLDDYKYVIVIATPFVPPVISSKLLRSTSTVVFIANKGENKGTSLLSRMNAGLADQAVIEESNIAEYWDLDEQNTKIGATFVPNKFKISTEYNERSPAIGYIGGLSERKGVDVLLNMIKRYDSR
jgi:glycosyltransferase involved in cell wall biosynthesis